MPPHSLPHTLSSSHTLLLLTSLSFGLYGGTFESELQNAMGLTEHSEKYLQD